MASVVVAWLVLYVGSVLACCAMFYVYVCVFVVSLRDMPGGLRMQHKAQVKKGLVL